MPEWTKKAEAWLKFVSSVIGSLFLLVVGCLAAVLVWRILTSDSSTTGTADERLLDMVKWTLGLVITVGGLLIGFSWFQIRSTRDEDKAALDSHRNSLSSAFEKALGSVDELRQDLESQRQMLDERSFQWASEMEAASQRVAQLDEAAKFGTTIAMRLFIHSSEVMLKQTHNKEDMDSLLNVIVGTVDQISEISLFINIANPLLEKMVDSLELKLNRGHQTTFTPEMLAIIHEVAHRLWDNAPFDNSGFLARWDAAFEKMGLIVTPK